MTPDKFELLREVIEQRIPFNRFLGLELQEAADGKARLSFPFKEELVGNFMTQVLHGGIIASVLDVIGACAVLSTFEKESPLYGMGTVDIRVDYLQPGAGKHFIATGEVMRGGRIISSTRMELYNDKEQLLAIGTAIYRVSRKDEPKPMNL